MDVADAHPFVFGGVPLSKKHRPMQTRSMHVSTRYHYQDPITIVPSLKRDLEAVGVTDAEVSEMMKAANTARTGEVWKTVVTKSAVNAVLNETLSIYKRLKMDRFAEENTAHNTAIAQQLHGALRLYIKDLEEEARKWHANYKYTHIMAELDGMSRESEPLRCEESLDLSGMQEEFNMTESQFLDLFE